MKFYISDTHLGHSNAIRFDNRPFDNVEEMEKKIIEKWNKKVSKNDEVYFVGDFIFRSDKTAVYYLNKLNGIKHLIIGNHDFQSIMNNEAAKRCFKSINQILVIDDNDKKIVLCHYPMASWWHKEKGVYHIYGHIHSSKGDVFEYMKKYDTALNCGCMINNYEPVTLEELIINNKKFKNKEVSMELGGDGD